MYFQSRTALTGKRCMQAEGTANTQLGTFASANPQADASACKRA